MKVTVGRTVLYYDGSGRPPLPAIVTHVEDERAENECAVDLVAFNGQSAIRLRGEAGDERLLRHAPLGQACHRPGLLVVAAEGLVNEAALYFIGAMAFFGLAALAPFVVPKISWWLIQRHYKKMARDAKK